MKPLYTKKNGTSQRVAAIEVKMPASYPASKTAYDNSNSDLSATDAQGAIDEVVGALDDLTATTLTASSSTNLSDGAGVTFTAQSDGYLIAYTTNSDTLVQISPVSDFSVSFTIVKNASSSLWSFDHVYLRKGMTVYVKATGGTHGNYRFCSIS